MRSKKFRMSQCLSPIEILAKVKRQFQRQRETQKIEQTLLYLNNSFNNNIQFQQIFIDIWKAKKDSIKSKQLKTIYTLISQNKANSLLFQKIVNTDMQNTNQQKELHETSTSKWTKEPKGLMQIIEEQELQTQINIKTKTILQKQSIRQSIASINDKQSYLSKKRGQRSSVNSLNLQSIQNEEENKFLLKRIYCRLMEKILVKIAFYTMNNRFLDFIASNILDLTKNLQIMIRRLDNIKNLSFLQQIVLKIYKENFIIENKIYQRLVDGGFIMSIDQFYRVNGIDVVHQDVYQRNIFLESEKEPKKKQKMTLKQKIAQIKGKKEKQNIVKKDYIDRTNQEINHKYLQCISQIKNILNEQEKIIEKKFQTTKEQQFSPIVQKKDKFKRTRMSLSKTQPITKQISNLTMQKQSRLSAKINENLVEKQQVLRDSNLSDESVPKSKQYLIKKATPNHKTFLNYLSRQSTFSPQFSKLIKESVTSPNKLQRNSVVLSEKFLEFNNLTKKPRKQSNNFSQSQESLLILPDRNSLKLRAKKSSQIYQSLAINRLLKLYETRNIERYSIQNFLGSNIQLPNDVNQILRQELLKLQHIYDPNSRTQSKKSSIHSPKGQKDNSSLSMNVSMNEIYLETNLQNQNQVNQMQKFHKNVTSQQSSLNVSFHKIVSNKQQYPQLILEQKLQSSTCKIKDQQQQEKNHNFHKKLRNEASLIKFQKDRQEKLKNHEKISPKNFCIFTINGVKNLCCSEEQAPFKNQRLKKIPYIKIKEKQTQEQLTLSTPNMKKNISSMTVQNSTKISSLSEHQSIQIQNLQKTIQQAINSTFIPKFQAFNANKIYHQIKSPQNKLFCIKNEIQGEVRKRQNRFQTFHPKFVTQISKNVSQQQQNIFRRTKKLKTTQYKNCGTNSQPISPCFSPNKENLSNSLFKVYDTRKKTKLFK